MSLKKTKSTSNKDYTDSMCVMLCNQIVLFVSFSCYIHNTLNKHIHIQIYMYTDVRVFFPS